MDNKKKIIVNATCASKHSTGVGVFTKELISKLTVMRPELFYVFGVDDFLDGFEDKKIISERCSPDHGPGGHFLRILWSQTLLPLEYMRKRGSLLFSTLPEAPVTINEIAHKTGLNPDSLRGIMNILTILDLFNYKKGRFFLTGMARKWCLKDSRYGYCTR